MGDFVATLGKRTTEYVQNMERKTKILVAVIALAVVGACIWLGIYMNRVEYATLYAGLEASKAGEIYSALEEQGVDVKMSGTSTILVPEDKVDSLRVTLAADGYMDSGLDYEMFTNSSDFGSTDLETRTRLQYTLQENLRTTISNMNKINDSIVIVNLATTSSYVVSSKTSEATAAVMVDIDKGETLTNAEARAIAEFVMKSVAGLKIENISIVDSDMKSYDLSENATDSETFSTSQQDLMEQMKEVLSGQVLRVLEPALGSGNVAVSVNLKMDFDKTTVNSVEFDPPIEGEADGLLRSSEETSDASNQGADGASPAGVDSNGVSYITTDGSATGTSSAKTSKIYNYELNEVQTQIEKAQGNISDLSVSVLINSDADGATAALDEINGLVANAIGVDSNYISVASLPFVESSDSGMSFGDYAALNQQNLDALARNQLIKTAVICGGILLAVVLVLGFLKKRREQDLERQLAAAEEYANASKLDITLDGTNEELTEDMLEQMMREKSSEVDKVEKLIENYPDAAVQLLRTWLAEDY